MSKDAITKLRVIDGGGRGNAPSPPVEAAPIADTDASSSPPRPRRASWPVLLLFLAGSLLGGVGAALVQSGWRP